jgi:hypothetical protein
MRAVYSIDMGWWRVPGGRRQLLCWYSTGSLYLGDVLVAVIPTETEMRRRLDGWADHCETRDGLGWLAQRLEGCR